MFLIRRPSSSVPNEPSDMSARWYGIHPVRNAIRLMSEFT